MDLTNFSYKELNDLEKLIREEKSKRETLLYKSDLCVMQTLRAFWYNELTTAGLNEYEINHYLHKIENSIFQICDFVMGNRRVKPTTKGNKVYHNTSNLAVNVDPEVYKALANDILGTMRNYSHENGHRD